MFTSCGMLFPASAVGCLTPHGVLALDSWDEGKGWGGV